ncbi:MAG: sigma-70 family RNA polymerase sigma factor [Gemmatimonadetes bacterium]|nr:sigma-70 family RNA polymerase sigma factor [Gemmatimonadota bacterium]
MPESPPPSDAPAGDVGPDAQPDPGAVTRLLRDFQSGDPHAGDQLYPLIYRELRRLAGSFMARERPGHTLQATVLVHEAFIRLAGQRRSEWQNRSHFMSIAASAMRRILVDHARSRGAEKRGGGRDPLTLHEDLSLSPTGDVDVLALHAALERLTELDARQGRVVELRFFAGLSVEEVADLLGISTPTVKRDWRHARAWLKRELER